MDSSQPDSTKKKVLSVSAAVRLANSILHEHTFTIEGEVSELNNKPGYKAVYFTIKDEDASLPCMIWKNRFQASGIDLHLGVKVQVSGNFNVYAPTGRMSFDVVRLVLAGEGDLRARVAQLAEKLRKEGLMDVSRKRPIPQLPQTIGLVTSPRGAVVHDVLRTLRRRYPLARVVFAGVPVEGTNAAQQLSMALTSVASTDAEVILLVRGGGSFENFMPFNDEGLARTIATCSKPVVTGIGHEPDTTIADMVADLRASTPTGAAQAVSPQAGELQELLQNQALRLSGSVTQRLRTSAAFLGSIASRPLFKDPTTLYASEMQTVDLMHETMERLGKTFTQKQNHSLDLISSAFVRIGKSLVIPYQSQAAVITSRLNDLSPLKILERGWSIARDNQGTIIKSVNQVKPQDHISVQLLDGVLACQIEDEGISELSEVISMEESHE